METIVNNEASRQFETLVHSMLEHLPSGPSSPSNIPSSTPSSSHPAPQNHLSTISSSLPSQYPPAQGSTSNNIPSPSSSERLVPAQNSTGLSFSSPSFGHLPSQDAAVSGQSSALPSFQYMALTQDLNPNETVPSSPMEMAEYFAGTTVQDIPYFPEDIDLPDSPDSDSSPSDFRILSEIPTTPSEIAAYLAAANSFQDIPLPEDVDIPDGDSFPSDFTISSDIPTTPSEIAAYLAAANSFQDIPLPEDIDAEDMDDSSSCVDQNTSSPPLSLDSAPPPVQNVSSGLSGLAEQPTTPSLYVKSFKRIRK